MCKDDVSKDVAPFNSTTLSSQPQISNHIEKVRELGIKQAKYDNNAYYQYDPQDNTHTLASDGFIYKEGEHSFSIMSIKEGSSFQDALPELEKQGMTQNVQAGMMNKSQSWISQQQNSSSTPETYIHSYEDDLEDVEYYEDSDEDDLEDAEYYEDSDEDDLEDAEYYEDSDEDEE